MIGLSESTKCAHIVKVCPLETFYFLLFCSIHWQLVLVWMRPGLWGCI